ncbi:MAG: pseudouridine synthase [Pseudomonadota bacterium]
MRIAKYLSRAGLASRREAESWVTQSRITINGTVVSHPSTRVHEHDEVCVDGQPVKPPQDITLWAFHKPLDVVVSRAGHGTTTIYDLLPETLARIHPVGRLDQNSEGLLLLTNHGGVKRYLEHPATGIERRYTVVVTGPGPAPRRLPPRALAQLRAGITVDGVAYRPMKVTLGGTAPSGGPRLHLTLTEGKNREIRRAMAAVGFPVQSLQRTGYGCVRLGRLPAGQYAPVSGAMQARLLAGYAPTGAESDTRSAP